MNAIEQGDIRNTKDRCRLGPRRGPSRARTRDCRAHREPRGRDALPRLRFGWASEVSFVGDLLWVVFGAAVVLQHSGMVALDWRVLLYAVLSLTVIRMLPVFLSLEGLGIPTDAKLFLGWFEPRGLARIVFLVIVVAKDLPNENTIIATTSAPDPTLVPMAFATSFAPIAQAM